jgi:hypothetical protein
VLYERAAATPWPQPDWGGLHRGSELQRTGLHSGAGLPSSTAMGLSSFGAITASGIVVVGFMWLIWHKSNCIHHKAAGGPFDEHRPQRQPH